MVDGIRESNGRSDVASEDATARPGPEEIARWRAIYRRRLPYPSRLVMH